MKSKKSLLLCCLLTLVMLAGTTKSNAAVNSKSATPNKYTIDVWMKKVREMECLGGTLGLQETLNSDLTSSSGSNNIDIHMEKNTEYGAAVILSASSYGKPSKIADGETTTGNETGIVMKTNDEMVAAGQITNSSVYRSANRKYKDAYTTTYVAKLGDAIKETEGWHVNNNPTNYWIRGDRGGILARSISYRDNNRESVFTYSGDGDYYIGSFGGHEDGIYNYTRNFVTRAAIVCGEGI